MRVFVTGASGWIGSAVVPQLRSAGHSVVGLARSDTSAAALVAAGAEAVRGSLDDVDTVRATAAGADGAVHLAFKHDIAFSGGFAAAVDADRAAIDAIGAAFAGTGRPFVLASGLLGLTPGRVATERDGGPGSAALTGPAAGRLANAHAVLALAADGVRSSVVRLPPTVHGDGDNGFLATLVATARRTGRAGFLGDGDNRWPAVHRSDAATLFHAALEDAPAGSVLHAVGDEGVAMRDVAAVIGRSLGVPVAAVADEDAAAHFTWMAGFVGLDSPASAVLTRELLGWTPTGPGLLEDLEAGHYFAQR